MANFDKYTNYTEETSFSEVIFAADSPLLEVELNEAQEILKTKMNRVIAQLGDGCYPDNDADYISYGIVGNSGFTVTLKNCTVISKYGLSVFIDKATVNQTWLTTSMYLYVRMREVEVDYQSTLRSYGNTEGKNIINLIKDSRWDNETSRRKVVEFTLLVGGSSISGKVGDFYFVTLGSFTIDGGGVHWKKISNLTDLAKDAAKQALVNKDKLSALKDLGQTWRKRATSVDWILKPSANSGTIKEGLERRYFIEYGEDMPDVSLWRAALNLIVRLKTNVTNKKIYKLLGSIQISNGCLKSDGNFNDDFWSNSYFSFTFQNFDLIVYGGDSSENKDFQYLMFTYVGTINNPDPLIPKTAKNGIGIILTLKEIYELNSDDVWVKTSDKFDDTSYFGLDLTTTDSCTILFIKIGADLSNYGGADSAFDSLSMDYNNLINKPQINSVTLQGNKTSADLHIEGGGGEGGTTDYTQLTNLPTLNGQTIIGDMQESDPVYNSEHISSSDVDTMLDNIFGGSN